MGRILIVNTLIESLFVYSFSVLPYVDQQILKNLQKTIMQFVWKGKSPKIAFQVLQSAKSQEGLRLVDLGLKHTAQKAQWAINIKGDTYL